MGNPSLCEKFQVYSSLRSDAIVFTTDSSNILEFRVDQMSPRNLGFQIIISRCWTRIDKTNIGFKKEDLEEPDGF